MFAPYLSPARWGRLLMHFLASPRAVYWLLLGWIMALLLVCSGLPGCAQPTSGLHYNAQDVQLWHERLLKGPYAHRSDAFPGSPDDAERIFRQAEGFRRDPLSTQKTLFAPAQIWAGSLQPGENYPVWEGIGLQSAAFLSLCFPDSIEMQAYVPLVLEALRFQLHQPGISVGAWPKDLSYEKGAKEAVWMERILYAADYLGKKLPASLHDSLCNYFCTAADYYVDRTNTGPIGQCFPGRKRNDYATLGRDALPAGAAYGIWGKGVYPGGQLLTHLDSAGRPGNRIANLARHYSNRLAEKMSFVAQAGLWCRRPDLVTEGRRFFEEWLTYSVYPDGTMAEYERNGNYRNPGQGMWYGALITQGYLLLAEEQRRRGDNSMYTFSTRRGMWGTEVKDPKAPAKTLKTVLDRYANNCTRRHPIYYMSVTDSNRIDNQSLRSGVHAPWDMQLALANRYYKSPWYQAVYERRAPGSRPMPLNRLGTAAGVGFPWGGTGAQLPAWLLMFGK